MSETGLSEEENRSITSALASLLYACLLSEQDDRILAGSCQSASTALRPARRPPREEESLEFLACAWGAGIFSESERSHPSGRAAESRMHQSQASALGAKGGADPFSPPGVHHVPYRTRIVVSSTSPARSSLILNEVLGDKLLT